MSFPAPRRLCFALAAVAALVLAGAAGTPAEAAPGSLEVRKTIKRELTFSGTGCGATATAQFALPSRAKQITVRTPKRGAAIKGASAGAPIVVVKRIERGEVALRWHVKTTAKTAPCKDPERFKSGWQVKTTARVTYTVSERLNHAVAWKHAHSVLKGRFPAYAKWAKKNWDRSALRCERRNDKRYDCGVAWKWNGKRFTGKIGVWLYAVRNGVNDKVRWAYSYRIERRNPKCLKAGKPAGKCVKVFKDQARR